MEWSTVEDQHHPKKYQLPGMILSSLKEGKFHISQDPSSCLNIKVGAADEDRPSFHLSNPAHRAPVLRKHVVRYKHQALSVSLCQSLTQWAQVNWRAPPLHPHECRQSHAKCREARGCSVGYVSLSHHLHVTCRVGGALVLQHETDSVLTTQELRWKDEASITP